MKSSEALARLRLIRTEGIGPQGFAQLLRRHGSAAAALQALPEHAARSGRTLASPSAAAAEKEIAALAAAGGRFLHLGTPDYPPLLTDLADAPPVLAVLGDVAMLSAPAVAIVGARNASAAGQRLAGELAAALAAAEQVVVSGLARGIDTAAHEGALRSGRTIAVVAGGWDCPYPSENAGLQARIAADGAVVAEAPWGTPPQARHFPRRNRLVAALALGVVVVEAAPRSGSLITARLALEMGREIFAVPGHPLDPRARGGNDLIRQGAHLTETAEDVLANLPQAPRQAGLFAAMGGWPAQVNSHSHSAGAAPGIAAPQAPITAPEPSDSQASSRQLIDLIGVTPIAVDDLLRRCQLSPAALRAALLDLELAGAVAMLPGDRVARSNATPF